MAWRCAVVKTSECFNRITEEESSSSPAAAEPDDLQRNSGIYVRYPEQAVEPAHQASDRLAGCRHVLITGLGRSGTTALAGIFQAFGFRFGETSPFMELPWLCGHLQNQQYDEVRQALSAWAGTGERHAWKEPKLRAQRHDAFLAALPMDIALVATFRDPLATALRVVGAATRPASEDFFVDLDKAVVQNPSWWGRFTAAGRE